MYKKLLWKKGERVCVCNEHEVKMSVNIFRKQCYPLLVRDKSLFPSVMKISISVIVYLWYVHKVSGGMKMTIWLEIFLSDFIVLI